ncbi:alpha-glucosidase [Anaerolineae bacterium]|nr:alpha-glucosidase [Anaerolineae bacterium]
MPVLPAHFTPTQKPAAAPESVVHGGKARFTILTDRLIRLEFHPEGCFEDRASQAFWFRAQPVPDFVAQTSEVRIEIETAALQLTYLPTVGTGSGFNADNLMITLKESGHVWRPGDSPDQNLLGTTRTLDFVNGCAPLETGLMSRQGWSLIDDSTAYVFNHGHFIEARVPGGTDWYFFGYGHDYKACLRDYCRISGEMPLIPRWILGNWWSRYWAYTQAELTALIEDFEAQQFPFSVCIIDMDWHLTKTGNASSGWTGYTWNRELFPDPEGLIQFLHQKGLKTALNLHPAEGIHNHETQYPEMAQRMGIDPQTGRPIKFNITDPTFVKAYFEVLHHPYESMGVDFWWVDWQQGQACDLPGLDPLWLINHLHFYDLGREVRRRPFIFSRWGREGHQRYPIGFSGDTYRTWESLRFQSYMTPTASNIGYGWWSHDIGGHTSGDNDPELFTRWVQFGAFSPILRIHVGKGEFYDSRPWQFEDVNVTNALREALQLRHALIPYLYSMAWNAHRDSLPLVQPMYYDYPEEEAAYHCPHQYLFGTELIAAPFVTPADPETGLSRQVVWLPAGEWYDFFSGERLKGDQWQPVYGQLNEIPVFAKAGAIVPLGPRTGWGGVENPDALEVHIFGGADHQFILYEDDGESQHFNHHQYCLTHFSQRWFGDRLEFALNTPPDKGLIPAERTFDLHFYGLGSAPQIKAELDGLPVSLSPTYDAQKETLSLKSLTIKSGSALRLVIQMPELNQGPCSLKREKLLRLLKFFKLHTGVRHRIAGEIDAIISDPERLIPYLIPMSESQAQAFIETLYEAGVQVLEDTDQPVSMILWNNLADSRITFRYGGLYLHFGNVEWSDQQRGIVPRFLSLIPFRKVWRQGTDGVVSHRPQWRVQIDYGNAHSVVKSHREVTP